MAGRKNSELINDNNAPLDELIHPLTYSLNYRIHSDMQAVPMSYKFSRNFKKLFDELR